MFYMHSWFNPREYLESQNLVVPNLAWWYCGQTPHTTLLANEAIYYIQFPVNWHEMLGWSETVQAGVKFFIMVLPGVWGSQGILEIY